MRVTHTYVTLAISQAAYTEIRAKLEAAGYGHAFMEDGEIDMHGLAVVPDTESSPPPSTAGKEHGSNKAGGGETLPPLRMDPPDAAGTNSSEKPEVTRAGLLDMQVCVPTAWDDAAVKAFADRKNPAGTENGWQIRRAGDAALGGDPERRPCAERAGFVHIVLDA